MSSNARLPRPYAATITPTEEPHKPLITPDLVMGLCLKTKIISIRLGARHE